ncbi:MAG TPA: 4'-phosphopantetheinyl transferase superfamily protein [Actinomycetota bacterium]|nr:4'-phosphopantetheinyl transferase superfamily protein [Actinomycetota bacterium]
MPPSAAGFPPLPPLVSGAAFLWLARIGGPGLPYDAGPLSSDEKDRAARFVFDRDRNRYIAARHVLRALLARYLGTEPAAVQFDYSRYGKPSIRSPEPSRVEFNLSHCEDWAVVGITTGARIGVDLERLRPLDDISGLALTCFSSAEIGHFNRLEADIRIEGFFNCWTRKEAFIKACGEGLSHPLQDFDVTLVPGEAARIVEIRDGGDPERWSLTAWRPIPGYVAAAAVDSAAVHFELAGVIDPLPAGSGTP